MRVLTGVLLLTSLALGGCESPEATRTRGGGPGGDIGNRPTNVRMHEGSEPYWETPVVIAGESASLEPAHQAQQLSQP
jgi:hypothetical protein